MTAKDPGWWRGAVIYQVYPRSYQDTTGDGVGDLPGITRRLPYIASLGVDAVWLSPFFRSPMKDFGYDVSDYRDVDPMFGTLADFDALIAEGDRLGLKIMIDLVLSHTSDAHPWFAESRADRENPRADWYVWADPRPDGTAPNNWLSIFGGPAWQWDTRREQYYMHNFLTAQPDLNFHNTAVQDALIDVATFWLERGVGGFRLDTVNFYFCDAALRDNPPLAPEKRNATVTTAVNPYNHQDHVYDKNRPETLGFLRRLRAAMDRYGAVAVGEVGESHRGLELLGAYTGGDDLLQMCYAFEFLSNARPDAAEIAAVMGRVDRVAADGWPCWAFSNHDVTRHASRWNLDAEGRRVYATLIACLRGAVCLYQGEELGLPEAEVPFELLQDPYGIEFWPEFKGRDGCRTPMVWRSDNGHGGFTEGDPWLPVAAEHLPLSVAAQEADAGALLHHYRRVIALRETHPVLADGAHGPVTATGAVLHFTRGEGEAMLFCAFNLSPDPARIPALEGTWSPAAPEVTAARPGADGTIDLGAWQACVLSRNTA